MADAAPLVHRLQGVLLGSAAASGSRDATAAAISRRVLRWVQRRASETPSVAVRMDDPYLGINCYLNSSEHFDSASVVKTIILATLLNKREREHLSLLSSRERQLARAMITESDNNAATALWDQDGMKNLSYFLNVAGMHNTQLNAAWGLTQNRSGRDKAAPQYPAAPEHGPRHPWADLRAQADGPSHRVTALGRVREYADRLQLHIKNGWAPLPYTSSPWYVNSTGAFTTTNPARDYTIVVLTHGSADETTGITTVEDVAGPINRALAGAGASVGPAHSKSYPSWNIPDEPVPPAPGR